MASRKPKLKVLKALPAKTATRPKAVVSGKQLICDAITNVLAFPDEWTNEEYVVTTVFTERLAAVMRTILSPRSKTVKDALTLLAMTFELDTVIPPAEDVFHVQCLHPISAKTVLDRVHAWRRNIHIMNAQTYGLRDERVQRFGQLFPVSDVSAIPDRSREVYLKFHLYNGNLTKIARSMALPRHELIELIHSNFELRLILESLREEQLDDIEENMLTMAQEKSFDAMKFVLGTRGGSRGYALPSAKGRGEDEPPPTKPREISPEMSTAEAQDLYRESLKRP